MVAMNKVRCQRFTTKILFVFALLFMLVAELTTIIAGIGTFNMWDRNMYAAGGGANIKGFKSMALTNQVRRVLTQERPDCSSPFTTYDPSTTAFHYGTV
jgi:hypothetical protein